MQKVMNQIRASYFDRSAHGIYYKAKRKNLFYRWTDLPSRISWSVQFFIFFFLMAKRLPKKLTQEKKKMLFEEIFWKMFFNHFQKFLAKFSLPLEKKFPKWKIWVSCAHKTEFFFFFFLT